MPVTRSVKRSAPRLAPGIATLLVGMLALALAPPATAARKRCAAAPSRSGEWPMYGHDVANSRDQRHERKIGPANVSSLSAAWVFSSAAYGDQSTFNTTPVVSGGCVFIGSAAGDLYAINASNGHLVWRRHLAVPSPGLGGAIVGAAAIHGRDVIWLVDETSGPYAIALDRSSGALRWRSKPFISKSGYYTNASPTVARGIVVAGYSDPEGNVLRLRGSLPPAARREYADTLSGGLEREDAWQRATEVLFERLAVAWTISGIETTRQKELLARYRVASADERRFVRDSLREHVTENFPELQAP